MPEINPAPHVPHLGPAPSLSSGTRFTCPQDRQVNFLDAMTAFSIQIFGNLYTIAQAAKKGRIGEKPAKKPRKPAIPAKYPS
jgi:hypothetical protein